MFTIANFSTKIIRIVYLIFFIITFDNFLNEIIFYIINVFEPKNIDSFLRIIRRFNIILSIKFYDMIFIYIRTIEKIVIL